MRSFDLETPRGYADMIEYVSKLHAVDPVQAFKYLQSQCDTLRAMFCAVDDSLHAIAEHTEGIASIVLDACPESSTDDLFDPLEKVRWRVDLVGWTNGVELNWANGYPKEVFAEPVALFIHTAVIEDQANGESEDEPQRATTGADNPSEGHSQTDVYGSD